MRAPVQLPAPRPSAKGEGGGNRKGRDARLTKGVPPAKQKAATKTKANAKGEQEVLKRLRSSSPGEANSLEGQRRDKTPPARSPSREGSTRTSPKRRPSSALPGKLPETRKEAPAKSSGGSSPKKNERGRSSTKPSREGSRSPEKAKTKRPSSKPSSRGSSTSSPKRSRKTSSSEVVIANGGERADLSPDGTTTRQERIARSIEAVISTLGKAITSSPSLGPPPSGAEPNTKEKPKPPKPKTSLKEGTPKEEPENTPRKRGRPKGSKNKVKKEGENKVGKNALRKKKVEEVKKEDTDLKGVRKVERAPSLQDESVQPPAAKRKRSKGRPPQQKTPPQKTTKKPTGGKTRLLSSKVLKTKNLKSNTKLKAPQKGAAKTASSPKGKAKPHSGDSSESDTELSPKTVKASNPKTKATKSRPAEEDSEHEPVESKSKKTRPQSPSKASPKGKTSSSSAEKPSKTPKKEQSSDSSDNDDDTEYVARPPKKALKEKWSQDLRKAAKAEEQQVPEETKKTPRRRREPLSYFTCVDSEDETESEDSSASPRGRKDSRKRSQSAGRKRKRKSSPEDAPTQAPKRPMRIARLNALAVMACLNEDAKQPLPSPPQPSPPAATETSSMALVLRESTIAHSHSGDDSEDSDDADPEHASSAPSKWSSSSASRRKGETASSSGPAAEAKTKSRRRRRRNELDVTMDLKDMVTPKRIASLNASAIMAASYSTETRRKPSQPSAPPARVATPHQGESSSSSTISSTSTSEVTNVDIKRKISFKATKASKSVITVQETTKKVKKAGATEVEESIIVKKKSVRRQSGVVTSSAASDGERDDGNATDTSDQLHLEEDHLLPKSPEDPRLLMESTLTLVTTQTAPGTVTLSGVSKYCITSADGRTTTVVQQVRKATATTAAAVPSSPTGPPPPTSVLPATSAIPTTHIPPMQHVQVPHHDAPRVQTRAPPSYSPLNALEVMQPIMHPHPPPPSSHFLPYPPHPPHGAPLPHTHHVHHHPPPPPHLPPHHHAPHPGSPYPPLSPHSPPYPPPPPSTSSSSPSPACTSSAPSSPSTTPHSCHPPVGYRSSVPCPNGSPGFPSPVSSPKQIPPQGGPPFRDPSPNARMPPSPNGPPERHHSAFSAPMPSAHAPTATPSTAHGYQPVSGPIPTGGSPNAGSYKPPQGSPGGTLAPPYSSPSRLTSPPPNNKPSPSFSPHHDPYAGPPHPYQSYPYTPVSPYDKYYSRTPAYHLYQPSYTGGQYPPQGDYGYQPPPPGTVHYSQESYTSYTLCVPAPPPHGSPQVPVTHPSALALPPPPPTSHHHTPPYATYHCTEYAPAFSYPPTGPSQNMTCCPAGNSKNVPSGPLTGVGKGPDPECGVKKLPSGAGTGVCPNSYHGAPKPHGLVHGPNGTPHTSQQSLIPPPNPVQKPYPPLQQEITSKATPPHSVTSDQANSSSPSSREAGPKQDAIQPPRKEDISKTEPKSQKPQEVIPRLPNASVSPEKSSLENKPHIPGPTPKNKPLPPLPPTPTTSPSATPPTNGVVSTFPITPTVSARILTQPTPSDTPFMALAVPQSSSPRRSPVVDRSSSSPQSPVAPPGDSKSCAAKWNSSSSSSTSSSNSNSSSNSSKINNSKNSSSKIGGVSPATESPTILGGDRGSSSAANKKAAEGSASASAPTSKPTSSACGNGTIAAAVPVFPAMPDPNRALQITTWVVQPSASLAAKPLSSSSPGRPSPRDAPTHAALLSPTSTTTSISLSNTNASTNSVMATTAPIVASLEGALLDPRSSPKTSVAPHGSTLDSRHREREVRWKEAARKDTPGRETEGTPSPVSQRTGIARHLLCQPLPLSHIKMPSVLARAKPSQAVSPKPPIEEPALKNILAGSNSTTVTVLNAPVTQTGGFLPVPKGLLTKEVPSEDKGMVVPRKRGRPPKVRDPPVTIEVPSSNGAQEDREHFWCAPGEANVREDKVPRRRMSLLKSSGAKSFLATPPSSPRKAKVPLLSPSSDLQEVKKDVKPQEDIMISVKTEAIGKIKTEKVSPKQGTFKDQKVKPLNGDGDADFGGISQKDIKTLLLPPPSLNLGSLDRKGQEALKTEQETEPPAKSEEKKVCIKRRGVEGDKGSGRTSVESTKGNKTAKPPLGRGKSAKNKLTRAGPKVRKKASLLAYLKEKNNESDASNGDPEQVDPVEDELRKLMEKDDSKNAKNPSPFTGYSAVSIRGRRASGAGRGKSVRKPKHCHGWSWEGDPHESKVWLRNDEVLMMRRCYKAMRHKEGDMIRVRDCVLLRSGPRKTDLPFVAKVAALWEDPETSDMMMSILWYYRPEHTDAGRREEDLADEIFASKHRDHLSVACIEDRCYVLTFNEYCRYRRLLRVFQERLNPLRSPVPDADENYLRKERQPPGCVVQDLLFFCRKVYDYRQKRILKNPC